MNRSKVILYFEVILTILALANSQNNFEKYEGHKIYELQFQFYNQQKKFFKNFPHLTQPLSTSRTKENTSLSLLITPSEELELSKYLQTNEISFEIINNNVAESIRNEQRAKDTEFSSPAKSIDFESYQRFEVINNYMDSLKEQYPERVKLISIGKSYEGRNLRALLISENFNNNLKERPLIFIDAGIHAREWIAPATALFVMQQLAENGSYYERELQMYDWLIWPLVNPDGYEYTHEHDRLWRKNLRPSNSSKCLGADLNRNFDYYWSLTGVSKRPCSEIYAGDGAFSEPESQALRDLLLSIRKTCRMYLTLHSYGNYLLYPWGYEKALPPTWPYLDSVACAGSRAIRTFSGSTFLVGGAANVLYPAAGGSDDYAFGVAQIPVVICMELSSGGNGFDPPSNQIQSIVEESWLGIRAMTLEAHEFPLRNVANRNVLSLVLMLGGLLVLTNGICASYIICS